MNGIIGQVLPLAVGIAISPLPIIAGILMLMSPRAKAASTGFLVGWLSGILIVTLLFALLSSVAPEQDENGSGWVRGVVQLALGMLLLVVAVRQWGQRPRAGADPKVPGWMMRIDGMGFGATLGLGLLLAAVNPKNLLLAASAGVTIGGTAVGTGETVVAVAVFAFVAGLTIIVPVVGFLIAPASLRAPLDRLRSWLLAENAVIMTVLLGVLGFVVLGKGIAGFGG